MRMRIIFAWFVLSILMLSCGGNSGNSPQPEKDTLASTVMPRSVVRKTASLVRQTANFFAFDENSDIFVGNSADDLEIVDVNGYNSTISPNGKYVAFTNVVADHRCVSLYDIDSSTNKILNFPIDNESYMGSFSPDSKFLAVNYFNGGYWTIALYDLAQDTFRIVPKDSKHDYFCPTFSPDGSKLVFHDMEKVYIYKFSEGKSSQEKVITADNFCPQNEMGISSACKFQLTDDNKYIVYDFESYSDEKEVSGLAYYEIESGEITEICDRQIFSCLDFELSYDATIYALFMPRASSEIANLFVSKIGESKPVKKSVKNFQLPCSFSISY